MPRRQGKAMFRRSRASGSSGTARASSTGDVGAGAHLRYRFDTALSKGPSVVISWLGLLTLSLILATALVLTIFRLTGVNGDTDHSLGVIEAFWQSLLRVVDAGTFAGDKGWFTRIVGLAITISGIFIAGSLIGLIANAVDQRIEELRKGRSRVIESDHTLILGWSNRVPAIVKELVIANESRSRAAVVIVAEHDKNEMEEALRQFVGDPKTTRIVCRSGEPWLPRTMELVNLAGARSVVVINGGNDVATVKALLSIRAATGSEPHSFHVVAEVNHVDTANSLRALFGDQLVTVSSDAVVAELTAQACRQRGLSTVFRELLDFDGDELYFAPFPALVGSTYADCQLAFERSAVIGVLGVDGVVRLNPPAASVLADGEQLIAVVEDDSLFLTAPSRIAGTVLASEPHVSDGGRRRIVISGWSDLGPRVIAELDEFLDEETTIELLLDPTHVDVESVRNTVTARHVQLEVNELVGGPEVVAAYAARVSFHEVIVLGYRGVLADDEADARTLLTLLAFRQVRQNEAVGPVRMVAELLDQRNAPLAEATGADDFIVSDELTSLMLAQLSERQELNQVFTDLFDRAGCSIELREAPMYGGHLARTFADVVATASAQGDSAIGYRLAASGAVVVNPAKSVPLTLQREDEVLVVAPGLS